MSVPVKSSLSPSRRRLVELMQRINFGRIEGLIIHDGDPVLDNPVPRVVLEVKLAGENGARPEASMASYSLKAQVVDLFAHFDRLGNAEIETLAVKHGLPFGMQVEATI